MAASTMSVRCLGSLNLYLPVRRMIFRDSGIGDRCVAHLASIEGVRALKVLDEDPSFWL